MSSGADEVMTDLLRPGECLDGGVGSRRLICMDGYLIVVDCTGMDEGGCWYGFQIAIKALWKSLRRGRCTQMLSGIR